MDLTIQKKREDFLELRREIKNGNLRKSNSVYHSSVYVKKHTF
jgi:hypothetical protein